MDYQQILASRPSGSTAEVAQTPHGVQIALRYGTWDYRTALRIWIGGFCLLAVLGVVALWDLIRMVVTDVSSVRALLPFPGVFLVGSGFMLWAFLVLGWGVFIFQRAKGARRDLFVVFPGGWSHRRGVYISGLQKEWFHPGDLTQPHVSEWWSSERGSEGWSHGAGGLFVQPRDLRSITVTPKRGLVAVVGGKQVTLTSCGSPADHQWLRETLLAAVAQPPSAPASTIRPQSRASQRMSPSVAPPKGLQVTPLADGSTRITRTLASRGPTAALLGVVGGVFFIVGWKGIPTALRVINGEVDGWGSNGLPGGWSLISSWVPVICTAISLLLGLGLILGALKSVLGRKEWVVRRGGLEVNEGFLGWQRSRRYANGVLRLRAHSDGEGGTTWSLAIDSKGKTDILNGSVSWTQDRCSSLGALISQETGWPFIDTS